MEQILNLQHDLRRDLHNLFNLLKFLKEDDQVKDTELKLMLEKNLEREKNINETLDKLSMIHKASE
jgi:hypothetical protein